MEEQEKILDGIAKSITSRLKIPIIITYLCVLILYNWDIIFYLFMESDAASNKIACIKTSYGSVYYLRIFICMLIAVLLVALFTIINTLLNLCLKWFYRKDKEISSEIESFEKINSLSEQLSQSLSELKKLKSHIENLETINKDLSRKDLKIDTSEISKVDFNNLISTLNSRTNKEKLLYSFKELLKLFKENPSIDSEDINNAATYTEEMQQMISILSEKKLLKPAYEYRSGKSRRITYFQGSKSFNDFMEMEF
jgi:hypothetical protein